MLADLVIKNGTLVPGGGMELRGAGVVVQGERIVAICATEEIPEAKWVIDAAGKFVVPGLIDTHVHTRAPGYEYKEDFETCSAAAAAGGITTILAMFNVKPPTTSAEGCANLAAHGNAHSLVNFNMYGLITDRNLGEIARMADLGISSFKFLMGYKYEPGAEDISAPADGPMLNAMRLIAEAGLPVAVHAENDEILLHRRQRLKAEGRRDPATHLEARPNIAEEEAVSRLILYSRRAGSRLHILHLSGREGAWLIRQAQREGLPITAETCPHYLFLTSEEHVAKHGTLAKINPPIRTITDQETLWECVRDGSIDVIGTDHAPQTDEEKMLRSPHADMWAALSGFAGVETNIPLMLTAVNDGRLTLPRLVEICSTNAARIFGLYPERGTLR
ncbi:MAG: dihydroorotase, partial [Armatimonadetes bacterium]|nr:dihydroorotase [Armatimonadota bacterium]